MSFAKFLNWFDEPASVTWDLNLTQILTRLESLVKQHQEYKQKLHKKEEELSLVQREQDTIDANLLSIQMSIHDLSDGIKHDNEAILVADSEWNDASKKFTEITQLIKTLEMRMHSLVSSLHQSEMEIKNLDDLHAKTSKELEEIRFKQSEIASRSSVVQSQFNHISEHPNAADQAVESKEVVTRKQPSLSIDRLKSKHDENASHLSRKASLLIAEQTLLSSKENFAISKLSQINSTRAAMVAKLESKKKEISAVKTSLDTHKSQLLKFSNTVDQLSVQKTQVSHDTMKIKKTVESLTIEKSVLENRVLDIRTHKSKVLVECYSVKDLIEKVNQDLHLQENLFIKAIQRSIGHIKHSDDIALKERLADVLKICTRFNVPNLVSKVLSQISSSKESSNANNSDPDIPLNIVIPVVCVNGGSLGPGSLTVTNFMLIFEGKHSDHLCVEFDYLLKTELIQSSNTALDDGLWTVVTSSSDIVSTTLGSTFSSGDTLESTKSTSLLKSPPSKAVEPPLIVGELVVSLKPDFINRFDTLEDKKSSSFWSHEIHFQGTLSDISLVNAALCHWISVFNSVPENSEIKLRTRSRSNLVPQSPADVIVEKHKSFDVELINSSEESSSRQLEIEMINEVEVVGVSGILSSFLLKSIIYFTPSRFRLSRWKLLYSIANNGVSWKTFFSKTADVRGTILLIKDHGCKIFGAYCSEPWKHSTGFYGSGESFVFEFKPELKKYNWTTENNLFQMSSLERVAIGGGGNFAIQLDKDILNGSSGKSSTYNSPMLSSCENFQVVLMEIWGSDS